MGIEGFGDAETSAEKVVSHFNDNGPAEVDAEHEKEKAEVLADYAMWDQQEKDAVKGKKALKPRMAKLFGDAPGLHAHGAHALDIAPVKGRTNGDWEAWARDMIGDREVDAFKADIEMVKAGTLDHKFITRKSDGVKYSVKDVKR